MPGHRPGYRFHHWARRGGLGRWTVGKKLLHKLLLRHQILDGNVDADTLVAISDSAVIQQSSAMPSPLVPFNSQTSSSLPRSLLPHCLITANKVSSLPNTSLSEDLFLSTSNLLDILPLQVFHFAKHRIATAFVGKDSGHFSPWFAGISESLMQLFCC